MPDEHNGGLSARSMTWAAALAGLAVLVLLCGLTVLALDRAGTSARVPSGAKSAPQLIVAPTGIDALARLEQTGMKGAYLIQFGTDAAFADIDFTSAVPTDSVQPARAYPFRLVDVQRYYVDNLRPDNYMLVAARTNLARKVDHVVGAGLFEQVRQSALQDPSPDIRATEDSVRVNLQGEVRHILPRLPRTREPFALLVNASYFSAAEPEELVRALTPYLPQISYIAVSEDQDDPSVDAETRTRAARFVDLVVKGLE